ncbi:MAG: metal-dependent transcriptional regulator [Eubacterium sp.]|nr:metal-dependent transcriptional regulator [Eubacterium sp.]
MQSNESKEMYLETILVLSQSKEHVRSVDVANDLGFKKSSVSVAMKHLREEKMIEVDEKGYITLTAAGKDIAEMIYERHQFLSEYLMKIGVPEDIAIDDACKIEHVISKESFEALKKRVKNLK